MLKKTITVVLKTCMVFIFVIGGISFNSSNQKGIGNTIYKYSSINKKLTNKDSELKEFERFDKSIKRFLRNWHINGATVAIAKDNKLIFAKGYGYADTENKTEVHPNNLFRIASVSKLVTATAIMKLQEEGKLSLSDKVFGEKGILNDEKFLKIRDKRRASKVTVEHLLRHQGGWIRKYGDQMFMPEVIAKKLKKPLPISVDDVIQFVLSKRFHFYPGMRSSYSNFGYAVLGKVIEKASGYEYEDYVKRFILSPIGITDMQLGGSFENEQAFNEVKYYTFNKAQDIAYNDKSVTVPKQYGSTHLKTLGAAGGWIASSIDLIKLMNALDGDPSITDILTPESIHKMWKPVNNHTSPIGWRKTNRHGKCWRTGTLAGTSALIVSQPDGLKWVFITNTGTWKGPKFYHYIESIMNANLRRIKEFPDHDLLEKENKITPLIL